MMSREATQLGLSVGRVLSGAEPNTVATALVSHCIAAFMQVHKMHPEQAKILLCAWINDQPFQAFIPDQKVANEQN